MKLTYIYRFTAPMNVSYLRVYRVTIMFAIIPEIGTNSDLLSITSILDKDLLCQMTIRCWDRSHGNIEW